MQMVGKWVKTFRSVVEAGNGSGAAGNPTQVGGYSSLAIAACRGDTAVRERRRHLTGHRPWWRTKWLTCWLRANGIPVDAAEVA